MSETDPVTAAIYGDIKEGIKVCLENECFGSALILIYSGIDTMACLSMPANRTEVNRDDYVQWCDKYIRLSGKDQLPGLELYGARCAVLHTFGIRSRLSSNDDCRMISYFPQGVPEVQYDPTIAPNDVLVSLDALVNAFFNGIDRFLVDLFADSARAAVAEERLQWLLVAFPKHEDD